jgi:hypothetical protein
MDPRRPLVGLKARFAPANGMTASAPAEAERGGLVVNLNTKT